MVASIMNQQLGAPITNVSQHKSAKADVQILELLGAGGSAKVYRGGLPPPPSPLPIKRK